MQVSSVMVAGCQKPSATSPGVVDLHACLSRRKFVLTCFEATNDRKDSRQRQGEAAEAEKA